MALLWYDGFEGLTQAQGTLRYATMTGGTDISSAAVPAPPNGRALGASGAGEASFLLPTKPSTVIIGDRFMVRDLGATITSAVNFLQLVDESLVVHLTFRCNLNGSIAVYRGDGVTLLGTTASTGLLQPGVWSYLEIKATIDDTTGAVEIKQSGTSVLSLTSIDTRNGGVAHVARVRMYGHSGIGNYSWHDDMYVCDTSGSAPYNDYLGDVRVLMIVPSAAGDSTQWTPNTGNNWAAVDETPGHDGDTTYVSDSTAGDTDLYTMADPSSSATIIRAAKVITTARKADAGAQNLELLVKSGSTTATSGNQALTDTYAEYSHTWNQNPDTSADWTIADLNALQSGFRIPV